MLNFHVAPINYKIFNICEIDSVKMDYESLSYTIERKSYIDK